jgi:hypothetical protein
MQQTTAPWQIAKLCRRLANIPASGGHRADSVLHALADKLDRETSFAEPPAREPPERDEHKARRRK